MNVFIAFIFGVTFVVGRDQFDIWKKPEMLKLYQMADKIVNRSKNVILYQVRTTTNITDYTNENGKKYIANYTCWSAQYTYGRLGERTRNFKVLVSYESDGKSKTSIKQPDEPVSTTSTENYTTRNAVKYEYSIDGTEMTDPVIFTDGTTCDLFNVPRNEAGKGCELWVTDSLKDKIPSCCSFIFDLLCSEYGNYDVYEKTSCTNVAEAWEKELKRETEDVKK
uniref:Putative lipocal-1 1 n=1 Tax=Amblyomma parvum TaxID=251391 RepID=A0A023G1L3_AMBPA